MRTQPNLFCQPTLSSFASSSATPGRSSHQPDSLLSSSKGKGGGVGSACGILRIFREGGQGKTSFDCDSPPSSHTPPSLEERKVDTEDSNSSSLRPGVLRRKLPGLFILIILRGCYTTKRELQCTDFLGCQGDFPSGCSPLHGRDLVDNPRGHSFGEPAAASWNARRLELPSLPPGKRGTAAAHLQAMGGGRDTRERERNLDNN